MGGSCVLDCILSRVGAEGALNVLSPPSGRFASAGFTRSSWMRPVYVLELSCSQRIEMRELQREPMTASPIRCEARGAACRCSSSTR